MSYCKDKMHQIRFQLGLCSRPRWELIALPQTPWLHLRGPTSNGRGEEREGREWKGREVLHAAAALGLAAQNLGPALLKKKLLLTQLPEHSLNEQQRCFVIVTLSLTSASNHLTALNAVRVMKIDV